MIGKQIRSIRHLYRLANNGRVNRLFLLSYDKNIHSASAVVASGSNVPMGCENWCLYIYNDFAGRKKPSRESFGRHNSFYDTVLAPQNNMWAGCFECTPNDISGNVNDINFFVNGIYLMPESFEQDYKNFRESNRKALSNIEDRYCSLDCGMAKFIYAMTDGSKDLFLWAIVAFFSNNIQLDEIMFALYWKNKYGQLSKNLKKGTITGYNNREQFNTLLHEMRGLRHSKRIKDVINSFNTAQKKILKNRALSSKDKVILSKFGKLSTTKRINFIKKMSTVEDGNEIMEQMSYSVNFKFDWNKTSVINYIKNTECINADIVIDKDDTLLVKVNEYDAVKYLAKATNWCISKNKTYWNQYLGNGSAATQYVLFDFSKPEDDKKSIIGFTSAYNQGITNAHDFVNTNIMGRGDDRSRITSFLDKFNKSKNIFNILDEKGISVGDVTSYDKLDYDWNKESFFEYLEACIGHYNYNVIKDEDNKVVVIAQSTDIGTFLGLAICECYDDFSTPFIIFADFSIKETNPDKLQFGYILKDRKTCESYVPEMFNQYANRTYKSFDLTLWEFGLPYNTISRPDNKIIRFNSALKNYDIENIRTMFCDEEFIKALNENRNKVSAESFHHAIHHLLFNVKNYELIELVYSNGFKISDFIGTAYMSRLMIFAFETLKNINRRLVIPSDVDIDNFIAGKEMDIEVAKYIGFFHALNMLICNETDFDAFYDITIMLNNYSKEYELVKYIAEKASDTIDRIDYPQLKCLYNYAINTNNKHVLNNIEKCGTKSEIKKLYEKFSYSRR